MPAEGTPAAYAVHATAVAIGGRALMITGRSGSGKSRLAAALVRASTPARRIVLVGDDRILLTRTDGGGLEARPHPRIAGFIERRGLGLVATPWCARARVVAAALLDDRAAAGPPWLGNLPVLHLVDGEELARPGAVLAWWSNGGRQATPRSRVAWDASVRS